VPVIAVDPYFSVWSFSDRLTDDMTRHWTGAHQPLVGLLCIDGRCWRFLGPVGGDALEQISVEVLPTRTCHVLRAGGIELRLTFTTPVLPQDLDVFSWPLAYVDAEIVAIDGRVHEVGMYLHVCGQIAVDNPSQWVNWSRFRFGEVQSVADDIRAVEGSLLSRRPAHQGHAGLLRRRIPRRRD